MKYSLGALASAAAICASGCRSITVYAPAAEKPTAITPVEPSTAPTSKVIRTPTASKHPATVAEEAKIPIEIPIPLALRMLACQLWCKQHPEATWQNYLQLSPLSEQETMMVVDLTQKYLQDLGGEKATSRYVGLQMAIDFEGQGMSKLSAETSDHLKEEQAKIIAGKTLQEARAFHSGAQDMVDTLSRAMISGRWPRRLNRFWSQDYTPPADNNIIQVKELPHP